MKTLKEFLEKNRACKDGFDFAKDLTLEEFLNTCERGDWILWLFARTNADSLRGLTLAKAYCANTVRELMKDERSIKAIDVAIAFGEGKATRKELDAAAFAATFAADAAYATAAYANAAYVAYATARAVSSLAGNAARKQNEKQTADICRKYLPLEIWNQNLII